MALIRIKNLLIRTYIGFNPEELVHKQDVVINMEVEVDLPEAAMEKDEPEGAAHCRFWPMPSTRTSSHIERW